MVDGESQEACLPIEPDALLAVHAEMHDGALEATVTRRPEANGHAIAVVVLARNDTAWEPLARSVLAPRDVGTSIPLPRIGAVPLWCARAS